MPLQSSGAISLANVQTEFGGVNPISISEYYGVDTGVPASGTISLSNFYGKSSVVYFTNRLNNPADPDGLVTGYSVSIDAADGSVYMCGLVTDPSPSGVIVKYNKSGVVQWIRKLASSSNVEFYDSTIDGAGNVYVCGPIDYTDKASVAKYNSSGALQWQREITNPGNTLAGIGMKMSGPADNFLYIGMGHIYAETEMVVAKLSPDNGLLLWQRQITGGALQEMYGLTANSSGDSYVCSASTSPADPYGPNDYLFFKYNNAGTLQWQRKLNGSNNYTWYFPQRGNVALDTSGNVYFVGSTDIGTKAFIAKYNSSGTIQWQKALSGVDSTCFSNCAADSSGNVYAVVGSGSSDACIVKYNSSGTMQWQRFFKRTNGKTGALGCIVDNSSGAIYVSGSYSEANFTVRGAILLKLKPDGSLTGTRDGFTYSASSFSDITASLTSSTPSFTSSTPTLTNSASAFTSSALTLTSTTTLMT